MKINVYNAAGGNSTAIIFDSGAKRQDYPMINSLIQRAYPEVEQVGFMESFDGAPSLQMAGGEFCGNATRSFACLLKDLNPEKDSFTFTVSGFKGIVNAEVRTKAPGDYYCSARFNGLTGAITRRSLSGKDVSIVDLGGITHIIVNAADFPINEASIMMDMKKIKDDLGVDADAVGVLWIESSSDQVKMRPVVWVKAIDTCYDETSCGSGTIAIALEKDRDTSVIQPTGKTIQANFSGSELILASEMERILSI